MSYNDLLQKATIAAKKLNRIPKDQLVSRLLSGIKKEFSNYPQYITLQTVSACNLQCRHCFINDYGEEIKDGHIRIMKMDEFVLATERLRDMILHAQTFCFSTFEALLNKNIFKMMDHLLSINPGLQFSLNSNTMLLNKEMVEQLERYPFSDITVSLDGLTKEVVEKFKTGVSFEQIISAIQLLVQSKLKDKLAVTFVAHADNIHELPGFVDFLNSLGVKNIFVSNILTFTPWNAHQALYTRDGNENAQNIFNEAIVRARKNNMTLQLPLLKPEIKGCQAVENYYIDVHGNVAPCDFLAVSTPFTLFGSTTKNAPTFFGNIWKDEPLAIYRSGPYQDFRKAHRLGKELPEVCKNCIDGYGLMCSNRTVYK